MCFICNNCIVFARCISLPKANITPDMLRCLEDINYINIEQGISVQIIFLNIQQV